jgi:hypothetical protein
MFIWNLSSCTQGNSVKLAQKAQAADFKWVTIKVCNGYAEFQTSMLGPAIDALRAVGIKVYGWGYIYGANSFYQSLAASEAKVAIKQISIFELDGFMMDPESEYKRLGASTWASTYIHAIRSSLPDISLGLCSYRFPSVHPELPWSIFLSHSDFHNPQVYWEGAHNSGQQLRKSVTELKALKDIPIVPVGSAYPQGTWFPTPYDLDDFYATAIDLKLPGWGWWSWQHAEAMQTWWDRISAHKNSELFTFPIEFPTVLTLEQRVERLEKEAKAHGWEI